MNLAPRRSTADSAPSSVWSSVTPVPVLAYDGPVSPRTRHLASQNPFHGWWWLRTGTAEIRHSGKRLRLSPGDWIFFPSAWQRTHRLSPDAHLVSIGFELAWPHGAPVLEMDAPLVGRGDADLLRLGARVALAYADPVGGFAEPLRNRQLGLAAWLEARGALCELASHLASRALAAGARVSPRTPRDARLARVLADIEAHPRAGPLPYDRWVAACGLGRVQLDRLARRHLGLSLRAWRDARLDREIRRQLGASRSSMKEIAAELGFADPAHFTHWVHRRLGTAPARWREDGA
jgi:AraC-like DNA-binding protein